MTKKLLDKLALTGSRADAKRQVILRGANSVFLKHGFGGASMDQVAAAARVSKMTVYRHFRSKEELFAGLIAELCDQIVDSNLESMMAHLPPASALQAFGEKMLTTVFDPGTIELHRLVIAECIRFPDLGKRFYASGPEACIRVLAGYLERNRNHPSLKITDPRTTAEEFMELLRGYTHLKILFGVQRTPTRAELKRRVESALRHVLKTR